MDIKELVGVGVIIFGLGIFVGVVIMSVVASIHFCGTINKDHE